MTARAVDTARLESLIAGIDSSIDSGESPRKIIDALCRDHGARHRFAHGTNELRMERVMATCTDDGHNLLRAWTRRARLAIEKAADV